MEKYFFVESFQFPAVTKKVEAPPTTHAGQGSQQTQRRILNSCKYVNTRGTGSQVTTIKGCDRFSDVFTIKMNLQVNINFMSPKSYSLRRPRATDGYALNQLVKRCPPLDTNSVYCNLLQCSDFSATGIAAEDSQGELVGFISGYRPPSRPDTLFVWQVAVDSRMRGQGLALNMLLALIRRCAADGVRWLETTISPGNTASEALFARAFSTLDVQAETRVLFSRAEHFDGQHDDEVLYRAGPFSPSALSTLSDKTQESA